MIIHLNFNDYLLKYSHWHLSDIWLSLLYINYISLKFQCSFQTVWTARWSLSCRPCLYPWPWSMGSLHSWGKHFIIYKRPVKNPRVAAIHSERCLQATAGCCVSANSIEIKSDMCKFQQSFQTVRHECMVTPNLYRGWVLRRNPDRSLKKEFSSLLFTAISTPLPWDFFFFKLTQPLIVYCTL